MSKSIVVLYHSGYGHIQGVSEAVAQGAQAQFIAIDAQGDLPKSVWKSLNAAHAIIFGTSTYMGGPSWQLKKFADASVAEIPDGDLKTAQLYGERIAGIAAKLG